MFYKILAVCTLLFLPLHALKIDRVILSTNNNPGYSEFWPIVAPLWSAMGIRPTLALIATDDFQVDTSLGDVIRFDPLPDIPESLQAQVIRLFLPILFPDDGCLISDIDMLPVYKPYFVGSAYACPDTSFLVYRDKAYKAKANRYPMCYLAAKGRLFGSIFGLSSAQEIPTHLRTWAQAGFGWNTDELLLYVYLKEWEKKGGHIFRLGHNVSSRLDRLNWPAVFLPNHISNYIDCHCPRPYSQHKQAIDAVVKAIYMQLQASEKKSGS